MNYTFVKYICGVFIIENNAKYMLVPRADVYMFFCR